MAAAPLPEQQPFQFHHSSPLDTLVRKTSARRPASKDQLHAARDERRWPQGLPSISTQQRQPYQVHHAAPSSPLLHSHFDRQSSATWGDNTSYLDLTKDLDPVQEIAYGGYDTPDTNHSSPALRDSWQSSNENETSRLDDDEWPTPMVVVSEPVPEQMGYATSLASKAPIIRPTVVNFSRPARSAVELPEAYEDEQKKRVLERNANRRSAADPQPSSIPIHPAGPPMRPQHSMRPDSASSHYSRDSTATLSQPPNNARGRSPEPFSPPTAGGIGPEHIALSRRPPSLRADSPASLYSKYSFYQLDSATPSPTDKQFSTRAAAPLQSEPSPKHVTFATSAPLQSPSGSSSPAMRTAQEFLQLGIAHHEADRLAESAMCFERAATVDGGCGVGMLMWGLALRHGWGCTKNEKHGFKWLRRAAEHAVTDLEAARMGGEINESAVETELVLAIYEVGQCFFHGWGIPKDQKMGVSYYAVAARMGDADAQMDLAFCLANGRGAKKDRKGAAKWYRAAVKQGQSDVGLAWIYKEKFQ
ncbi:hypothetical protein GGX14DRAFT_429097 [Mycena pura]|uniref:HCP-like protein n=1 Tax=Mycena pura TaxID=153505 RepID=A0AAD6YLI0_9AGAR|nr:hypothetical protein GGX14DRAFT_429097 [Mycena pura]